MLPQDDDTVIDVRAGASGQCANDLLTYPVRTQVPAEWSSTTAYCATLGHKANHSFTNNAMYDVYENHPRFGHIKCGGLLLLF